MKPKAGGEIINLPSKKYEGHNATIIEHARAISHECPDLAGFFVIGWEEDGTYSVGWRYDRNWGIPARLFPSWIAEVARDEIITQDTACDVVNRALVEE